MPASSRTSPFSELTDYLLGPPVPSVLPERVAAAIRVQETRSEILICLIQLVAVVFFAGLYLAAPKGFDAAISFQPVPLTLAAYTLFVALRLRLALQGRLASPFIALSIVVDVAVLMLTIWSFHLQYGGGPTIYLKAPTLLYIFIIIAMRALSFDPGWVLLTGTAAALGWAVLLGYALLDAATAAKLTRHFAEYATSDKLLIGAEIDKIIAILAVTLVLALALERARRLLIRSVIDQTAAAELSRYFAPEIAASIIGAPQRLEAGSGVARQAAIMFIDLRGFTSLANTLEPKALVVLLNAYHDTVLPIVHQHNGSVITYLGDGIMITFGASRPSGTCAADAVRAAEDLIEKLETWARTRRQEGLPMLRAGIGVTYGPVVCGTIGTEGRLEFATIGDAVNRAARLQGLTKSEAVPALITATAWERAIEQGLTPRTPFERRACSLAGIDEPVEVVALI